MTAPFSFFSMEMFLNTDKTVAIAASPLWLPLFSVLQQTSSFDTTLPWPLLLSLFFQTKDTMIGSTMLVMLPGKSQIGASQDASVQMPTSHLPCRDTGGFKRIPEGVQWSECC